MAIKMGEEEKILERTKKVLEEIAKLDLKPLFELDRELAASPQLRAEFIKDPFSVAEKYGFKMPQNLKDEGFHMHWIDSNNNYYPAEGSAIEQLQKSGTKPWTRVEVRIGTAPGCIALCGICF